MGLIGLLFNAVTVPGLIVNQLVQSVFEGQYGAPTKRIAMPEDLDENALEENPELLGEVRTLKPDETPRQDEAVEHVVDYAGITEYNNLFGLVLGPFFATSVIALLLFTGTVSIELAGIVERTDSPLLWLAAFYPGFAIAAHAFPNAEPTNELLHRSQQTTSLFRFIGYPLVAISKGINLLRFLWVDAIYAIVLYLLVAVSLGLY